MVITDTSIEINRTESSNLLAVLDELHTHALSDGGVGLLGLNTNLFEDNSLGVRRTLQCSSVYVQWHSILSLMLFPFHRSLSTIFTEGCTYSEWRGLVCGTQQSLLVVKICPLLLTAVVAELARGQKTSWLSLSHIGCKCVLVCSRQRMLIRIVWRVGVHIVGVVSCAQRCLR